jgi:hypothetical protein
MSLEFYDSIQSGPRQWLLNLGQLSPGNHHWLLEDINQFGIFAGEQMFPNSFFHCKTLTTTYSLSTGLYTLYCNEKEFQSKILQSKFYITTFQIYVGVNMWSPYEVNFRGCINQINIYDFELTATEVATLVKKYEPPTPLPTISPTNRPTFEGETNSPTLLPSSLEGINALSFCNHILMIN